MKNADYLHDKTYGFLENFRTDYGIELIGIESDEHEDVEAACSWNGHSVGYVTRRIQRLTFTANGFVIVHPDGGEVSGLFPTPIKALEILMDADGDELDNEDWQARLCNSVIAKCGPIGALSAIGLI